MIKYEYVDIVCLLLDEKCFTNACFTNALSPKSRGQNTSLLLPWNYNTNRNNSKKISCYMRDSAYRRRIVENAKIFWSCAKYFLNFSACKKLNGSPNDITEVSASFLGLLKKQRTLRLPLFSIFFSRNVLEYWRNQSKKYFRDYRTYNTIQLFVAIKGKFLDYSFSAHVAEKMNSPKISW